MAIRDEHFIERQGKRMVLFAGLLDQGHQQGLKSIDTELIQAPGQDNGSVAIVKAVVELEDGRRFSGIGDASPENVGRMIAPHLLRMAETRAKARALRDAVNVGVTAFEEMGGDEEPAQGSGTIRTTEDTRQAARDVQRQSSQASEQTERTKGGATRKSAGALWHRVGGKNGAAEWEAENGVISEMSQEQVSRHLDELKGEA